jgi:hypothetical protein
VAIFARSCYTTLIEFDGFLSACSAQAEAQCIEKPKPIDLPIKTDTIV